MISVDKLKEMTIALIQQLEESDRGFLIIIYNLIKRHQEK